MAGWATTFLFAASVFMPPRPATASISDRHSASNAILGISTACSADSMNITVRMRHPFRGILYSRGFPLECSTAREQHHKLFDFLQQKQRDRDREADGGTRDSASDTANRVPPLQPSKEVTISLPASECGIRVVPSKDGEGLWLQTSVVVQLDRHLQQAADQIRTASCHLDAKDSSILLQPLQTVHGQRTGRKFGDDIPSVDFAAASSSSSSWSSLSNGPTPMAWQTQQQHWQRARAIMEILTTAGSSGRARGHDPGVLTVGEEAALIVTSHLPAGVGARVTDCFAHDGAGESMERLSDGRGCPTDRLILPQLREVQGPSVGQHSGQGLQSEYRKRKKRTLNSGLNTYVTAAKFAAFKFPDRSRLHLRCQLQLCRGTCPQDSCLSDKANMTRQERRARKGERGEILGRLQVFNSVEVLAPGIEGDDRLRLDELTGAHGTAGSATHSAHAGEKTFCLSPPKMALALATLGSLLLCAVAVALYSLLRGHKHPHAVNDLGDAAPFRAFLRRHFLRLRECNASHGSSASLGERNVLVRVQDSPFGHHGPPSPTPGQSGEKPLWQDKLFH